jgi:hypothetical protein
MQQTIRPKNYMSNYIPIEEGSSWLIYRVLAYNIETKKPEMLQHMKGQNYGQYMHTHREAQAMDDELISITKYGFTSYGEVY